MNRFAYALTVASSLQQEPFINIAHGFINAVYQVVSEGGNPVDDPAVIVLGSFIAFHVHADVNTRNGYEHLLSLCETGVANSPEVQ